MSLLGLNTIDTCLFMVVQIIVEAFYSRFTVFIIVPMFVVSS